MKRIAITIIIYSFLSISYLFSQSSEWLHFPYSSDVRDMKLKGKFLYFATSGGVAKINTTNNEISLFNKANSGIPSNSAFQIAVLDENVFIVNCAYKGLFKFDNGTWQQCNPPGHNLSLAQFEGDNGYTFLDFDYQNRLLVGTLRGGHIWDGANWKSFTTSEFGVTYYNMVTSIMTDSKNNLFVGTPDGMGIFDGIKWKKEPLGSIVSIIEDKNNTIWIYSNTKGLIKYDYDSVKYFNNDNSLIKKLAYPSSTYIYLSYWMNITDNGHIYLASFYYDTYEQREILDFDGTNWKKITGPELDIETYYRGIMVDSSGILWIGSTKGVFYLKDEKWQFVNPSNNDLPFFVVWNLTVDRSNNIWHGINRDLIKYDGNTWKSYRIIDQFGRFNEIDVDSNNTIWVALDIGLYSFNEITVNRVYESDPITGEKIVRLLEIDDSNNVWFSSDYILVKYNLSTFQYYPLPESVFPPDVAVYLIDMHFDSYGNLWILTNNGLIKFNGIEWQIFNFEEDRFSIDPQNFDIDSNNNIWVGVYYYGLLKFDGSQWTVFNKQNSDIQSNLVTAVKVDQNDNIWIGAAANPENNSCLIKFDGNTFTTFDDKNSSYYASWINNIVIDKLNNKWIGTMYDGILVFKENGLVIPPLNNSLSASTQDDNVLLKWITNHEINNMSYEVERNTENTWTSIGQVDGNPIETVMAHHSFIDTLAPVFTNNNFRYRIKFLQNNNFASYSNEVIVLPTSIDVNDELPTQYSLSQNFPNPFNPITRISYDIPVESNVSIKIYDILGKEVTALLNENKKPGRYEIEWNARNIPSGIYFYVLSASGNVFSKKMCLLK